MVHQSRITPSNPGVVQGMRDMARERSRAASTLKVEEIPLSPGSYSIWHDDGRLLYVGLAGVRWTSENPSKYSTLRQRLNDHLDARRADVLTSYLFERVVASALNGQALTAMGDGSLSIRDLVRDLFRTSVRIAWCVTDDYATARLVESAGRSGGLGSLPLINPLRDPVATIDPDPA